MLNRTVIGLLVALVTSALAATSPAAAYKDNHLNTVGTGTHPWVVVLCTFKNSPALRADDPKYTLDYFRRMYTAAGRGSWGVFDYFRDVSFGQLSLEGTTVHPKWVVATERDGRELTREQWDALPGGRRDRVDVCANGASGEVDFSRYYGVVALFPEAVTSTTTQIDADDTTVSVRDTPSFPELFPTVPYDVRIEPGNENEEIVRVTAVNGTTLTIQRGRRGTTAKSHGSNAVVNAGGDLGAVEDHDGGQRGVQLESGWFDLATVVLPHQAGVMIAAHEMGHGMGFGHPSAMSSSTESYNDCTDIMSAVTCVYSWSDTGPGAIGTAYGESTMGEGIAMKGPGFTVPQLNRQSWIPASRRLNISTAPTQATVTMRSLGDPTALANTTGLLETRMPRAVRIPRAFDTSTTSDYLTVEYREKSGWDRGFPADGVSLHLHGQDDRSYWIDQTPDAANKGLIDAGERYVDATNNIYVVVHSKSSVANTARVTVANRKINATLARTGTTSGRLGQRVTLSARMTVAGAPVTSEPVTLAVGSQACLGWTTSTGNVSCSLILTGTRGTRTFTARFAGDEAYNPASTSGSFRVYGYATRLTYTGPSSVEHGIRTRVRAQLVRTDGTPVQGAAVRFTLANAHTCSGWTNSAGSAACTITATSQPSDAPYLMRTTFAGNAYHEGSSDYDWVSIVRARSRLSYTGPTTLTNFAPVTFTATLRDTAGRPIASKTVSFQLGKEEHFRTQGCEGGTDEYGRVSCTLSRVWQPSGPQPLIVRFAGSASYGAAEQRLTVTVQ